MVATSHIVNGQKICCDELMKMMINAAGGEDISSSAFSRSFVNACKHIGASNNGGNIKLTVTWTN